MGATCIEGGQGPGVGLLRGLDRFFAIDVIIGMAINADIRQEMSGMMEDDLSADTLSAFVASQRS